MKYRTKRILLYHIYEFAFRREKEKQAYKALAKDAPKREKKRHEDFCYQYAGSVWCINHVLGDIYKDNSHLNYEVITVGSRLESKAVKDAKTLDAPWTFEEIAQYLETFGFYVDGDDS